MNQRPFGKPLGNQRGWVWCEVQPKKRRAATHYTVEVPHTGYYSSWRLGGRGLNISLGLVRAPSPLPEHDFGGDPSSMKHKGSKSRAAKADVPHPGSPKHAPGWGRRKFRLWQFSDLQTSAVAPTENSRESTPPLEVFALAANQRHDSKSDGLAIELEGIEPPTSTPQRYPRGGALLRHSSNRLHRGLLRFTMKLGFSSEKRLRQCSTKAPLFPLSGELLFFPGFLVARYPCCCF